MSGFEKHSSELLRPGVIFRQGMATLHMMLVAPASKPGKMLEECVPDNGCFVLDTAITGSTDQRRGVIHVDLLNVEKFIQRE